MIFSRWQRLMSEIRQDPPDTITEVQFDISLRFDKTDNPHPTSIAVEICVSPSTTC